MGSKPANPHPRTPQVVKLIQLAGSCRLVAPFIYILERERPVL
jgi:hypothetical protein